MKARVIVTLTDTFINKYEDIVYKIPTRDFIVACFPSEETNSKYDIVNLSMFQRIEHVTSNTEDINDMFSMSDYTNKKIEHFDEIWNLFKHKVIEDVDDCIKYDWVM